MTSKGVEKKRQKVTKNQTKIDVTIEAEKMSKNVKKS